MQLTVSTKEAQTGFYPTPPKLAEELVSGLDLYKISTILEPSAGTGNLIRALESRASLYCGNDVTVDCCEIDPALRGILKEGLKKTRFKRVTVVHDDFLTFDTYMSYDAIIMNPPFANGDTHLLKAISMQERTGGIIRCLLNAETLHNPYTNQRKALCRKLEELNASITYVSGAFQHASRPTDVEVAIIKLDIPKNQWHSAIWERCVKAEQEAEPVSQSPTDLVLPDSIKQAVSHFNVEVSAGVQLIREYIAMKPYILEDLRDTKYAYPILGMSVCSDHVYRDSNPSVNDYVKAVRKKYWKALFGNKEFTGQLTSNLVDLLHSRLNEMADLDFSEYNIRVVLAEMNAAMTQGVQDTILDLFEKLTYKNAYSEEVDNGNVHYFTGWKTNKAWMVNSKVIIPFYAFSSWGRLDEYRAYQFLSDIEKALNYLDGHMTAEVRLEYALQVAKNAGNTRNIHCKFFDVTFYKKGTAHIKFICPELIDRFNIYCAQHKNWLPPRYGRAAYHDLDTEEKAVVDSFHGDGSDGSGETQYKKIVVNASYYLAPPSGSTLALGCGE